MAADGTLACLYSFSGDTDGSNPNGGLLLSRDGNLYGATETGGAYGFGTVFRVSPDGTLITLAHFDDYQGANPEGTLVQGADGNLYGTTANGGQSGEGAIFRLNIDSPLQITRQPQPQRAFLGDTVVFNIATFGGLPVSYQWLQNGKNLADTESRFGSNARTLLLTNITIADAADYSVVVSNASGSVTESGRGPDEHGLIVRSPDARLAWSAFSNSAFTGKLTTVGLRMVCPIGSSRTAVTWWR
jgi:uncharacterized repeat protein (TIGR03803 family)